MLGDANNPIRSILDSGTLMPTGATAIAASSADVAAAAAVATLPAVAAVTNYLTGFRIAGTGATAGVGVAVTITGLAAGTLTFVYTAVAGAILANTPLEIVFPNALPASGANTAIAVTCPSLGVGALHNSALAHGYKI